MALQKNGSIYIFLGLVFVGFLFFGTPDSAEAACAPGYRQELEAYGVFYGSWKISVCELPPNPVYFMSPEEYAETVSPYEEHCAVPLYKCVPIPATPCTSAPNSCGETNQGIVRSDGSCSALPPSDESCPPREDRVDCTVHTGTRRCEDVAGSYGIPSSHTEGSISFEQRSCRTNGGPSVWEPPEQTGGSCSAPTPPPVTPPSSACTPAVGTSCTSAPNVCGETDSGVIQSDCSCSASRPSNASCDIGGETPSGCSATTIDDCTLGSASHARSSGTCTAGTFGSCAYTCFDGSWARSDNSCSTTEVITGPPEVTVSPRLIEAGDTITLTAIPNGHQNCMLTGGTYNQTVLPSATFSETPTVSANTTFTLSCDGGSDSATVEVVPREFET